jgi:hypothetical protein
MKTPQLTQILFMGLLLPAFAATASTVIDIPSVIYHFGSKDHLLQDIKSKTIPNDIWENAIMSNQSRFGLKPYRRGLYGATTPGKAIAYGDSEIHEEKLPWFMEIHIKDECRAENAVLKSFYSLPDDSRFQAALTSLPSGASFTNAQDFKKRCLDPLSHQLDLYAIGEAASELICEKVVHEFMDAKSIKLVGDDGWDDSWYIRDHSCISSITGEPNEILNMMATMPNFWRLDALGDPLSGNLDGMTNGSAYLVMLLDILQSMDFIEPGIITSLKGKVSQSDFLDFQEEPFALWAREPGVQLIEAWERCYNKKAIAEFKAEAENEKKRLWKSMFQVGPFPRPVFRLWTSNLAPNMKKICH